MTAPFEDRVGTSLRRGLPLALLAALALAVGMEAGLWSTRRHYLLDDPLIYDVKLERLERGPKDEVLVLGSSLGLAALRPGLLGPMPGGRGVYNYSLPGIGPSGGRIALRRHLAAGGIPSVVVLTYSAAIMAEGEVLFGWEGRSRFLYRLTDVVEMLREGAPPDRALSWLATRPSSVRYRRSIRSAALARAIDTIPATAEPLRQLLGYGDDALSRFQFEWLYRERQERNESFVAALETEGGWRYLRFAALPGERIPERARFRTRALQLRPEARQGLEQLVAFCEAEGIAVLVAPAPLPRGLVEALGDEGSRMMARLFEEVYGSRPNVHVAGPPVPGYPHRYFGDRLHLNPAGAERFTAELEPALRKLLNALREERP